ncbi:hypothetical protein ASF20_19265 [Methylobacterium sp. Leaf88]|nr:hypothetical protein ASF20_19265 [Methylobacterium sp. Leaf88]
MQKRHVDAVVLGTYCSPTGFQLRDGRQWYRRELKELRDAGFRYGSTVSIRIAVEVVERRWVHIEGDCACQTAAREIGDKWFGLPRVLKGDQHIGVD